MREILSFAFLLVTCSALPNPDAVLKAEQQQDLTPKKNEKRQLNVSRGISPQQTQFGVYGNLSPQSFYSPNFRGINDGQSVVTSSRPITVVGTDGTTSPQTLGAGSNILLANPTLGIGQGYPSYGLGTTLGIGQSYPTFGIGQTYPTFGVGQTFPSFGIGQSYPNIGLGTQGIGLGNTGFGLGTTGIGLGTTGIGLGTTGVGLGTTGLVYAGGYPYNIGVGGNTLGLGGVGVYNLGGTGGLGYGGFNSQGLGGFNNLGGIGVNSLGGYIPSTIGGVGGRGFTHGVDGGLGNPGIIGTSFNNPGFGTNDQGIYNNVGFNNLNPGFNNLNPGFNNLNPGFNNLNPGFNNLNPGFNTPNPLYNNFNSPGYNNVNIRDRNQRGFNRPGEERRPNRRERENE